MNQEQLEQKRKYNRDRYRNNQTVRENALDLARNRRENDPGYVERNRIRSSKWREENKERARSRFLMNTYGITSTDYEDILELQGGCCAICGKTQEEEIEKTGKRLAVDHDHVTGEVRGILCGNCNRAFGLFQENPEILQSAIRYSNRR